MIPFLTPVPEAFAGDDRHRSATRQRAVQACSTHHATSMVASDRGTDAGGLTARPAGDGSRESSTFQHGRQVLCGYTAISDDLG